MNRFSNRALSLVLATIFLFSAAGISFGVLFKGTTVLAVEDVYAKLPQFYLLNEQTGEANGNPTTSAIQNKKYKLVIPIVERRVTLLQICKTKDITNDDGTITTIVDMDLGYAVLRDDLQPEFTAIISDSNFRELAPPPGNHIKPVTFVNFNETKDGMITYDIVFPCVEYMGGSELLNFTVNYPASLGLSSMMFQVKAGQLPSSSNNDYDRPSKDDDDESSSSRPDIPPPTPNIIVSEYSYGGGTVTAAGNFSLKVKFTNTSAKLPIDNIVMKVGVPEAFTITSSSNTFYVDKMAKNASVERTINLSVKPNADPVSHPIKLSFTFEAVIDEARKQYTSEQEISVPVAQLDRFSLNSVEVPPELFVGEDMGVEATFINKGKTTVYNVTAEITGNIAQPGQRQFIGNVEGGKEDSADFLISPLEAGPVSGEIIITYEDANMNVNELRSPFTANATSFEPPPMDTEVINPEDMPAEVVAWYLTVPAWGWMVGGVVLIIFAAFAVKIVRARREKKLEEQDEDF